MTRVNITVEDRFLGQVHMDNGSMSDMIGRELNEDPKDMILRELDRTTARVKAAYGIDTTVSAERLGRAAAQVMNTNASFDMSHTQVGEAIMALLAQPEKPKGRPIKDQPQA